MAILWQQLPVRRPRNRDRAKAVFSDFLARPSMGERYSIVLIVLAALLFAVGAFYIVEQAAGVHELLPMIEP